MDRDPFADPAVPHLTPQEWAETLAGMAAGQAHNAAVARRAQEERERVKARRERQRAAGRRRTGTNESGLLDAEES